MEENPTPPLPEWTPASLFKVGFFVELGLVLVAAGIGIIAWRAPFPFRVAASGPDLLRALAATAPLVVVAVLLTSPVGRRIAVLERIYVRVREVMGKPLLGFTLADMVLLAGAAGVGEEILFRGAIQPLLGLWPTSLVFGLLHALTPTYLVLAGLMGAYLGWLYDATGNLLVPIVVHWLYDAVALYLLRRRFASDPELAPAARAGSPPEVGSRAGGQARPDAGSAPHAASAPDSGTPREADDAESGRTPVGSTDATDGRGEPGAPGEMTAPDGPRPATAAGATAAPARPPGPDGTPGSTGPDTEEENP